MTDDVLLVGTVLAKRTPVAAVRHKERVVPESLIALLLFTDAPFAAAFGHDFATIGPSKHHHRAETCGALRNGYAGKLRHQSRPIRCVVMVAAAVVRRLDARSTIERVDLETAVVGQRHMTRCFGDGHGLESGITDERVRILDDLGYLGWSRKQLDCGTEHGSHLIELVLIGGCSNNHQRRCWISHAGQEGSARVLVVPR